jgi:hypothetical protein
MDVKAAKKAIIEGFRRTDESLLQESTKGNWQDGATAVCVWILGQMVVVANAGDAKAVLARSTSTNGEGVVGDTKSQLKAIVLTREHKAIFPQERSRIQKVICVMYSIFFFFNTSCQLNFCFIRNFHIQLLFYVLSSVAANSLLGLRSPM